MRKNGFLYYLALAPLLMGADVAQNTTPLTVDKLPACAEGQFLVYVGAGVSCKTITSTGGTQFRDCTGRLLTSGPDEVTPFDCVDKGRSGGSIDVTTLNNLEKKVIELGTIVTQIGGTTGTGRATYVGSTTNSYKGDFRTIAGAGIDNGLAAGTKVCDTQFAGSHVCTGAEIYESITKGVINSTKNISAKAWIWSPSWSLPPGLPGAAQDPNAGVSDNCASYTYNTGDRGWGGIAVQTGNLNNTAWGVKFHGGINARCSDSYQIACCK